MYNERLEILGEGPFQRLQMLLAEVAEALAAAGETPYFMMNPCRVNAEYYNTAVRGFVAARGF